MTILPKKKQDSKNSEQDDRSRRNYTRDRRSNQGDDHGLSNESSTLHRPIPIYNDLDARHSSDTLSHPYTRPRHIQGYYLGASASSSARRVSREPSPEYQEDNTEDGYNSSDEHGPKIYEPDVQQKELCFEKQLQEKKGYQVKQMVPDGACLFRAVADQVYGDQEMHTVVRKHCMDYMVKNRDYFSEYITEDFPSYIRRKRSDQAHGNHVEMQALSEMYSRPIEVFQYSLDPINTFHSRVPTRDDNAPIRVSYHGNVHYNSIINPYNPTVGVGLGLPGYKPGHSILKKTILESEAHQLEKEMLEDKKKATDWEATDEQLAEIVARESYIQWMNESQRASGRGTSSATCTSSSLSKRSSPPRELSHDDASAGVVPKHKKVHSPKRHSPSPPRSVPKPFEDKPSSSTGQYKDDFPQASAAAAHDWQYALDLNEDLADWNSDPVLAAVLAQSEKEYIESLKSSSSPHS